MFSTMAAAMGYVLSWFWTAATEPIVAVEGLWVLLYSAVATFVKWQLNPIVALNLGADCLGFVFQVYGVWAGGDVGGAMLTVGNFLATDSVLKGWNLALWFCSPIVDPAVVRTCVAAIWNCWILAMGLKFLMWIKGFIWMGGQA